MTRSRGPWSHRFLINFFTLVLAALVYWTLGFIVDDLGSAEGPRYRDIEARFLDPSAAERAKQLKEELAAAERNIAAKREEMRIISDSSSNLQGTINQLVELRKLEIQKSGDREGGEAANLSDSLAAFLANQKQYQARSEELSRLAERKRTLEAEGAALEKALEAQREPARREYERLAEKHWFRTGALRAGVILPFLGAGAWLVMKKRESDYFPLFLAFGGASLLKASLVIHEYFPSRYFKYIVVLSLLAVVARALVLLIRAAASPGLRRLMKQYREGYERFLCPVCEYPIRTGPRQYMYWTRRTVNKVPLSGQGEKEEPYSCPNCGTALFEKCAVCGGLRHSLLPFCRRCGAEKEITAVEGEK